MVKRYELTDTQWQRIEPMLPGKSGDPGRTGADNRLFVNADILQNLTDTTRKWAGNRDAAMA